METSRQILISRNKYISGEIDKNTYLQKVDKIPILHDSKYLETDIWRERQMHIQRQTKYTSVKKDKYTSEERKIYLEKNRQINIWRERQVDSWKGKNLER